MKVILLNNVPKVGKRYEVKNVADGFAANYLIPRRLAEVATVKKVAELETRQTRGEEEAKAQAGLLHESLQSLKEAKITISSKANEKGHLFQGLHQKEIVEAIQNEHNVSLPEEAIVLPEPIKEIGEHVLTISLGEKNIKLTLVVEKVE